MRWTSSAVVCLVSGSLVNGVAHQQDAVAINTTEPSVASSDIRGISDWVQPCDWDDTWDLVKDVGSCALCHGALAALRLLAAAGDKPFIKIVSFICRKFTSQDDDVCDGAVASEGPIIASSLRNSSLFRTRTATQLCVGFADVCDYPDVNEWSVPFASEKPDRKRPVPKAKKTIKVVHYSDIHIDPLYTVGASTQSKKKISCRPNPADSSPGAPGNQAGPYGDHKCDAPVSLEKSLYKAIGEIVPDAAFALFTGDLIHHAMWNTSQESNEHEIHDAYRLMKGVPGTVYGTAGNHESHPTNGFQPPEAGNSSAWLYDLLSDEWSPSIGAAAAQRAEKMGAYSTKYPHGNLRIISLNTNYNYRHNFYLYREQMLQDPGEQIAWLAKELHAAEKAGENVYILGHMPLGTFDSIHDQSNYLDQVINRFEATIAGMFFGHTHRDEFQLSYSNNKLKSHENAIVTSYVAPSLTPTSGHPAFKVYEVDAETFAVLDATTYIADMSNKAFQTTGPVWTKYYSAKETYGKLVSPPVTDPKAELSAAFWHNLTEVFENDDQTFARYFLRKTRGWKNPDRWEACVGECQKKEICKMRAARSQDNCYELDPGFEFRKRDTDKSTLVQDTHDCGFSVTRSTIGYASTHKEAVVLLQQAADKEKRKRDMCVG